MGGQVLVDPAITLRDNLDALPLVTRQAVESSRGEGVIQIHHRFPFLEPIDPLM